MPVLEAQDHQTSQAVLEQALAQAARRGRRASRLRRWGCRGVDLAVVGKVGVGRGDQC
jgi:hypothetical protein